MCIVHHKGGGEGGVRAGSKEEEEGSGMPARRSIPILLPAAPGLKYNRSNPPQWLDAQKQQAAMGSLNLGSFHNKNTRKK